MGVFSGMYDRYVRPICSYLVALSLVVQCIFPGGSVAIAQEAHLDVASAPGDGVEPSVDEVVADGEDKSVDSAANEQDTPKDSEPVVDDEVAVEPVLDVSITSFEAQSNFVRGPTMSSAAVEKPGFDVVLGGLVVGSEYDVVVDFLDSETGEVVHYTKDDKVVSTCSWTKSVKADGESVEVAFDKDEFDFAPYAGRFFEPRVSVYAGGELVCEKTFDDEEHRVFVVGVEESVSDDGAGAFKVTGLPKDFAVVAQGQLVVDGKEVSHFETDVVSDETGIASGKFAYDVTSGGEASSVVSVGLFDGDEFKVLATTEAKVALKAVEPEVVEPEAEPETEPEDVEVELMSGGEWSSFATVSWKSGSCVITFADGTTQTESIVARHAWHWSGRIFCVSVRGSVCGRMRPVHTTATATGRVSLKADDIGESGVCGLGPRFFSRRNS